MELNKINGEVNGEIEDNPNNNKIDEG